MTNQELLIQQLESSVEFLQHEYDTTKDPKQLAKLKEELFDAQVLLKKVKGGECEDI
jgi:hypothetical protein